MARLAASASVETAQNRTEPHQIASSASRLLALTGFLGLPLAGCATLTPGQRIALYCNPIASALDLATLNTVGSIDRCVQAVHDRIESAELRHQYEKDCLRPAPNPDRAWWCREGTHE
jgi:hypothetical protein